MITEKRIINYSFNAGIEWEPAGRLSNSEGLVFYAKNNLSGIVLNLIIGTDPIRNKNSLEIENVEEDNCFGEKYAKGNIADWSEIKNAKGFMQKMTFTFYYILYKAMTIGFQKREVVGSHVFNIMDKPHFAFTYFMGDLINRKYSIYFTPQNSKVSFEFVFTASFQGNYQNFLPRIIQVDKIVKSLKISSKAK